MHRCDDANITVICKNLGMSANGATLSKNLITNHFLAFGLNMLVGTRGVTPNPG